MPCCGTISATTSWATDVQIGSESKQYVVQLKRNVGCCYEGDYQIFVNGTELEDHGLTYRRWGPLCTSGGSYEWDQDGHRFHLMYDKVARNNKGYRLFVDGNDVVTGLEFTAFWRLRAIQVFITGCVMMAIVALVYIFVFVVFKVSISHMGSMAGINATFCFGVGNFIVALIIYIKFIRGGKYNSQFKSSGPDYRSFRDV